MWDQSLSPLRHLRISGTTPYALQFHPVSGIQVHFVFHLICTHTHITFFKHNTDDVVLHILKFKFMQHQNISVVHITYKVYIALIDSDE